VRSVRLVREGRRHSRARPPLCTRHPLGGRMCGGGH
jgi:hypothetical protein